MSSLRNPLCALRLAIIEGKAVVSITQLNRHSFNPIHAVFVTVKLHGLLRVVKLASPILSTSKRSRGTGAVG